MTPQYKIKDRISYLKKRIKAFETLIEDGFGNKKSLRQCVRGYKKELSILKSELKSRTSGLTYSPFAYLGESSWKKH